MKTIMKPTTVKDTIAFEDFEKLDIRVGTITSVEEVPDSRKLMKLAVDFGHHNRTILAGIKQEFVKAINETSRCFLISKILCG